MIVVLASDRDAAARSFAERAGAARIAPHDLSRAGWRWSRANGSERAVAEGSVIDAAAITGVVSRLGWIPDHELGHIHVGDRRFLAWEMTAFLLAWLSELPCPVVNPPAPGSLCGPGWTHARWAAFAAAAGVPVAPVRWPALEPPKQRVAVDVVGGRSLTAAPRTVRRHAERLARAARLPALRLWFASGAFVTADPWVALERPEVAEAVLAELAGGCG